MSWITCISPLWIGIALVGALMFRAWQARKLHLDDIIELIAFAGALFAAGAMLRAAFRLPPHEHEAWGMLTGALVVGPSAARGAFVVLRRAAQEAPIHTHKGIKWTALTSQVTARLHGPLPERIGCLRVHPRQPLPQRLHVPPLRWPRRLRPQ